MAKKRKFSLKRHVVGICCAVGVVIAAATANIMYAAYAPMIEANAAANQVNDSMTDFVLFRAVASGVPEIILWSMAGIFVLLFLLPTIIDLVKSNK